MITKDFSTIRDMSIAERILLVEEIWDSIAANPETVPLTDSQKTELDKRLRSYYEAPDAGAPWEKVKDKILSHK